MKFSERKKLVFWGAVLYNRGQRTGRYVGIGRRPRLKIVCCKACGFESHYRHQTKNDPNQVFVIGDGFGLFVFFEKFENTHFRNGVVKRPESKPRGPRKPKMKKD